MSRTRAATLLFIVCLAAASARLAAESLRGPLEHELVVTPTASASVSGIGIESIVLISLGGDPRFLDAIDIELTAPRAISEFPGALSLHLLAPVDVQERAGVADVVGAEILRRPVTRPGTSFYQAVLRDDARVDASPMVTSLGSVPARSFPLALSIVPQMKGLSETLEASEFSLLVRPVTRDSGAIVVRYVREDGSMFDPEGARAPDFSVILDDAPTSVRGEYLVSPGLHRIRLQSERYQDQEITVGVDRGTSVTVDLPLELSLARISYTAPRGSVVYINGRELDAARGDFTVPPGEHTIVLVLGDFTVTRRFTVVEDRDYSISVALDVTVKEEAK